MLVFIMIGCEGFEGGSFVTKKKKKSIKSKGIVICILLVIAIILIIILTFNSVHSNVKSKYYVDELVKINNHTDDLKIQSNIVQDSGSLVMVISSDASKPRMVTVNAEFFNDEGDSIYSDQVSNFVMSDGKMLMNIILPNLDEDDYAGDILLEVTDDSANKEDFLDVSKITYEESHATAEDNSITFEITGTNGSDSVISRLEGSIVALKDNKIVAFNNFNLNNIDANSTFTTTVSLPGVLEKDEIVPIDYDDVLIFTSTANPA